MLTNSIQQAPPSAAVGLHWCRAKNQNHVFMESLHSILPSSSSSRNSMRESWPPSYGKDDDATAAMVKSPSRQWCLTVRLVLVWSGCTTSNHFHSVLVVVPFLSSLVYLREDVTQGTRSSLPTSNQLRCHPVLWLCLHGGANFCVSRIKCSPSVLSRGACRCTSWHCARRRTDRL